MSGAGPRRSSRLSQKREAVAAARRVADGMQADDESKRVMDEALAVLEQPDEDDDIMPELEGKHNNDNNINNPNNNVSSSTAMLPKINITTFNGSSDIKGWLDHFEDVAQYGQWTEEQKLRLLPVYLTGPARSWLSQLSAAEKASYQLVKTALLKQFQGLPVHVRVQLKNKKQRIDQSVQSYYDEWILLFERLSALANNAVLDDYTWQFVDGLLPPIQARVAMTNPQSIRSAYDNAIVAEYAEKINPTGVTTAAHLINPPSTFVDCNAIVRPNSSPNVENTTVADVLRELRGFKRTIEQKFNIFNDRITRLEQRMDYERERYIPRWNNDRHRAPPPRWSDYDSTMDRWTNSRDNLVVNSDYRDSNNYTNNSARSSSVCTFCGKPGHDITICRLRLNTQQMARDLNIKPREPSRPFPATTTVSSVPTQSKNQ